MQQLATRQLLACQAADENGPCHCVEEPWKDRGFFGARIGDSRRYNTTKTCPSCGHARQEHVPVTGPSIRKTAQGLPREKGNCPDCWGNGYTYDISRANEPIISGYFQDEDGVVHPISTATRGGYTVVTCPTCHGAGMVP